MNSVKISKVSSPIRTRFAPSPTGYMHVGNLRTALYAYLFARSNNGAFVLRIEDTDQERYVEDAVDFIYRTLKGAGITHDEGPDAGGGYGPYVQSERKGIYAKYAEDLVKKGHAYYCFCDRRANDVRTVDDSDRIGYNRKCRSLTDEEVAKRLEHGEKYVIRQKIPLEGVTAYEDLVYGHIETENISLDDQILLKSDGMPTYNFANVIDDHLMEISHIIRGADFISSTPKYQLLYDGFGWEAPCYAHLPLIMGQNEDGSTSKLSKRHGATGFEQLVDNGYLPEAITNYVSLLGWSPKENREILSLDEMAKDFKLSDVNKSSAIFDYKKLAWMNGEYIHRMCVSEFVSASKRFVELPESLEDKRADICALLKDRVDTFCEIQGKIDFFIEAKPYSIDMFINKKNKLDADSSLDVLERLAFAFGDVNDWSLDTLNEITAKYAQELDKKIGYIMWPLRLAVSACMVTPGGATEIMYILGKAEALKRIGSAIEFLRKNTSL